MKIYDVSKLSTRDGISSNIVEKLLADGYINEPVFSECYYKIHIDVDNDSMNQVYRMLWESSYLHQSKRSHFTLSDTGETIFVLQLSLVDAIGFIRFATPPILQNRISYSLKSSDSIRDVLSTMLIECKDEYHGYFRQFIRMIEFETQWQQDDSKIDTLWKLQNDKPGTIISLEVYDCSFDNVITRSFLDHAYIQVTFKFHEDNISESIKDFIHCSTDNIRIINIKHETTNHTWYISSAYIDCMQSPPERFLTLVRHSYNQIISDK